MISRIRVYHGFGSSSWWKKGIKDCSYILLPYNYVLDSKIPEWLLQELQSKTWILDSGSARYFLNNGYPEFPFAIDSYLDFVDRWQPTIFVSMDYATENFQQWHWVDRTIEKNNLIFDMWTTRGMISDFMPVIQGFSKESYEYCAEESKDLIRSVRHFGIGSVCRAKIGKITEVLETLNKIVDLSKAHLFGQTIRTLPALHKFGIRSTDTSNASVHASFKAIRDRYGILYYSQRSPKKNKHYLDHLSYEKFFLINKREIEAVASGNFGLHCFLGSTKSRSVK